MSFQQCQSALGEGKSLWFGDDMVNNPFYHNVTGNEWNARRMNPWSNFIITEAKMFLWLCSPIEILWSCPFPLIFLVCGGQSSWMIFVYGKCSLLFTVCISGLLFTLWLCTGLWYVPVIIEICWGWVVEKFPTPTYSNKHFKLTDQNNCLKLYHNMAKSKQPKTTHTPTSRIKIMPVFLSISGNFQKWQVKKSTYKSLATGKEILHNSQFVH